MNTKSFLMLSMLYVMPCMTMQQKQDAKAAASKQVIIKKLENYCEVADKNPGLKFMIPLLNKAYMTCHSPKPAEECEMAYAWAVFIANFPLDENALNSNSDK